MAGADLFFNIFGRDHSAEKTFKKVGKAADDAGKKILGMQKSTAILAATTAAPIAAPLVGTMLALPGILSEAAGGMAAVGVATRGMGDAFKASTKGGKEFNDAMVKLTPAAQRFVTEALSLKPALAGLRKATQESMFRGLSGELGALSKTYLPLLRKQLPLIAHDVGGVAISFTQWARSTDTVSRVQKILMHTGGDLRLIGATARESAASFVTLANAALPFTTRLLQGFERGAAGFHRWVAEAEKAGRLDALFSKTSGAMDEMGHTATLLTQIVGNIFANPNTVQAATTLLSELNLGLTIVKNLTGAFTALPGGVQQAILSFAGLALVTKQLGTGTTGLVNLMSKGLAATWDRGSKAANTMSSTLSGMATKTGVVVGAVVGLGLALHEFGQMMVRPTEHDVTKLATSLEKLGRTSRVTGEASKVIGRDMSVLFGLMDKINNVRPSSNASALITSFVGKPQDVKSTKQLSENFHEIDQALTQLVQGGQAGAAGAAFETLAGMWARGGKSVRELNSHLGNYRAAQEAASAAAMGASTGFGSATANARLLSIGLEQAVHEGQKLTDIFTELNGGAINFDHAQLAASESIARFKDMVKENGHALDQNSLAGQRNRVSIEDMITAANAAAQAKLEVASRTMTESQALEASETVWRRNVANIMRAGAAAGFNSARIDAMIAQYARMPATKSTQVTAPGAKPATGQVAALNAQIAAVKDKLARVNVIGPVAAATQVGQLRAQLDRLQSRRISVITEFTYKGRQSGIGNGVGGIATGGYIGRRFAGGGFNGPVMGPGTGTSDSIPAWLSNGEYVLKASAVRKLGLPLLDRMNAVGMASGGPVKHGSVSEARWRQLIAAGWRGRNDDMEALYAPGSRSGASRGRAAVAFPRLSSMPHSGKEVWSAADKLARFVKAAFSGNREGSLLKLITTDSKALSSLANQRTSVVKKLASAQARLTDLTKASQDVKASTVQKIMSSFSLTGGSEGETATGMIGRLQSSVTGANQFRDRIGVLRRRGLASGLLQQLADAGPDQGNSAALALVRAGGGEFQQINSLFGQLGSSANSTGVAMSQALYGSGIAAAQGLVKGLTSQQKAIEKAMTSLTSAMVSAVKHALGIKSPSRVMHKLGVHTATGFAHGIAAGHGQVADAASMMARSAMAGASASGGGGGATYNITVNAAPGTNARELGRQLMEAIRAYEKGGGKTWAAA